MLFRFKADVVCGGAVSCDVAFGRTFDSGAFAADTLSLDTRASRPFVALLHAMETTVVSGIAVVVPDSNAQACRINVVVAKQKDGAENDFGNEIQNTVEDGFGVWRKVVSAFAQAPGNRVDDPQDQCQDSACHEDPRYVRAKGGSAPSGCPSQLVDDV